MKTKCVLAAWAALLCLPLTLFLCGCNTGKADPKAEAPPQANVEADFDPNNFAVDHPERFRLSIRLSPL